MEMHHMSMSTVIDKLKGKECVIDGYSAASLAMYSCGSMLDRIDVIALEELNIPDIVCTVVDSETYRNIETRILIEDIKVITHAECAREMLELEVRHEVDNQVLQEVLSKYYYENSESFGTLLPTLTDAELAILKDYEEDAINYFSY